MNIDKAEIAHTLDIGEEHYRKLEVGHTGLSVDKMFMLYEK